MNIKFNILICLCTLYAGCAFTLVAPLKSLKKSESKHTLYFPMGYQYQRGISDDLEIGLDLGFVNIGGNLRYHLDKSDRSLNSIQIGLARTGIHVNYMYTYIASTTSYIRFGPISSYQFGSVFAGSGESANRTLRLGGAFTYGGDNWWINLGYSHPVYTNYHIRELYFSESSFEKLQYGNSIYSLDLKLGYSF